MADDPEILPALGRGDFKPYFAWVKPAVHAAPAWLFRHPGEGGHRPAAGRDALMRHLRRRYLEEPAPKPPERLEKTADALATIEGDVSHWIRFVGVAIDVFGVVIIVIGLAWATFAFLRRGRWSARYENYRVQVGRSLLLGLEVLVAADIVKTVALEPTFTSLKVCSPASSWCAHFSAGPWPWRSRGVGRGRARPRRSETHAHRRNLAMVIAST